MIKNERMNEWIFIVCRYNYEFSYVSDNVGVFSRCGSVRKLIKDNPSMTFAWIMGRDEEGTSATMMEVCVTSISNRYVQCLRWWVPLQAS